jgi:hypothetical protein
MKKTLGSLFTIVACALVSSQARAAVYATWDYDSGTAYAGTTPYAANTLNSTVFSAGSMSSVTLGNAASQGAGGGDASTTALTFTSPTTTGSGSRNVNGATFVLSLRTSSQVSVLADFVITYRCLSSQTDANVVNAWTLAGASTGNGTVNGSITKNGPGVWDSVTVTFSGVTVGANTTFTLTDALSGYANNPGGFASFDNVSFDAAFTQVPEPVQYALPLFGLIFVGARVRRYCLVRFGRA